MLQHQVYNLFCSKLLSDISYLLFVCCIRLPHVTIENPSLKTFFRPVISMHLLIARERALFQIS